MEVLIVNQSEVPKLLPMAECIEVMAEAFKSLAGGNDILPLRPVMWLPQKVGALGMMPAYVDDLKVMGVKVVSVFPGNEGTEHDSHQGTVMIYEAAHGSLLAIVDASEITAIRTAATTGLATRLLARDDADTLAILGSGIQARSHLEAMLAVRHIRRVRVWSRKAENAAAFVAQARKRYDVTIETAETVAQAVKPADIICTTTAAPEPILRREWIAAGTHINAVGSSVSFTRELDTATMVASRLFVDRRESTLNEAGDFLMPKKEGAVGDDHILAELGDLVSGSAAGRETKTEITLFKSLGLAIEDVAAAMHVYRQAKEQDAGTWVEIGGRRHA